MKLSKPDIKNYITAFEDSLSITDEQIAQYAGVGKFWVDTRDYTKSRLAPVKPGWIEVLLNQPVYNPFNVNFIDERKIIKLKDNKVQRKKMQPKPPKKRKRNLKKRNDFYKSLHSKNVL